MSSTLTSVRRHVFASHWLWTASMDGRSLYFKTTLRVGSVIFSAAESCFEYLEWFRFFTIFEKKSFRVSAVSDSRREIYFQRPGKIFSRICDSAVTFKKRFSGEFYFAHKFEKYFSWWFYFIDHTFNREYGKFFPSKIVPFELYTVLWSVK